MYFAIIAVMTRAAEAYTPRGPLLQYFINIGSPNFIFCLFFC